MKVVIASLLKSVRQLADPAVVRVLTKSLGITIAVFVLAGAGLYFALRAGFAYAGMGDGGLAGATAAALIAVLAFWFLFRVVALAVLQFFADEVVSAVEARHYPDAAQFTRKLPFRRELTHSMRGLLRALGYNALALPVAAVLIFTAIGPALVFLLVNAVLLGRELTDMAWLRLRQSDDDKTPVSARDRFLLGGVIAGLMVIPGLGLLAPVIGAAAGTHVTHGAMNNGRGATGRDDNANA